jgi:hypothetical protein
MVFHIFEPTPLSREHTNLFANRRRENLECDELTAAAEKLNEAGRKSLQGSPQVVFK